MCAACDALQHFLSLVLCVPFLATSLALLKHNWYSLLILCSAAFRAWQHLGLNARLSLKAGFALADSFLFEDPHTTQFQIDSQLLTHGLLPAWLASAAASLTSGGRI